MSKQKHETKTLYIYTDVFKDSRILGNAPAFPVLRYFRFPANGIPGIPGADQVSVVCAHVGVVLNPMGKVSAHMSRHTAIRLDLKIVRAVRAILEKQVVVPL